MALLHLEKFLGHTEWIGASFHLLFAAKPGLQKGGDTKQRLGEVQPKFCHCREHDCILKVSLATIGGCAQGLHLVFVVKLAH